jgi:hypothetical protein
MKNQLLVLVAPAIFLVRCSIHPVDTGEAPERKGVLHRNVTATVFWVGEPADADNDYIANDQSAWDDYWETDFGGVDDPSNRNGFWPAGFTPKENPFYYALPYNDLSGDNPKGSAMRLVYWATSNGWHADVSYCKNHWVEIILGNDTAFAQWEDCGPFNEDDSSYVFGMALPMNTQNDTAGIDLSPATRDYLGLGDMGKVSWEFVDDTAVPSGPWKQIVTSSGVNY